MQTVDTLRTAREAIISEWAQRIRGMLKAAVSLPEDELRDNFPQLLDSIILSLEQGEHNDKAVELRNYMAREHALLRARTPDFTIDDVMEEYRAFREILLRHVEQTSQCDVHEMETIGTAMFNAVTISAALFAKAQQARIINLVDQLQHERERTHLFVAALTHDIRQPLSVAQNSVFTLQRKPDDFNSIVRIRTGIDRISGMIDNLLDVMRMETGRILPINPQPVRVPELVSRVLDEYRASHGERFVIEFDHDIEAVWDERKVIRALTNLLENAVKYSHEYSPVTVTLTDQGANVAISVHNFGNPIPANELATLFDPFRRAVAIETSGVRGWGLGLAIVKTMAAAHGGSVTVESSIENGTRFTLKLPKTPPQ